MEAYLYQLKLFNTDEKYPVEIEFIVVGDNPIKRESEAQRVEAFYTQNAKRDVEKTSLSSPIKLEGSLSTESGTDLLDWVALEARIQNQIKTRPRGVSCIFRGPAKENDELCSPEEVKARKESIEYFIDDHRENGEQFLFIGSNWELETRERTGTVCVFEASSINLAADLIELYFLTSTHKNRTTLTEWCGAIYLT